MADQRKYAVVAGSLTDGFALKAIVEKEAGEDAAIKLMADGIMAEAILIQDPKKLSSEYDAIADGSILVAFGAIGNGIEIFGPFDDSEEASQFAELTRSDDEEYEVFELNQMNMSNFLAVLQKKYPSKEFHRITHEGAEAIGFMLNGIFIHDCTGSSCGRFLRADFYGIDELDARKMLNFNQEYIDLMR